MKPDPSPESARERERHIRRVVQARQLRSEDARNDALSTISIWLLLIAIATAIAWFVIR